MSKKVPPLWLCALILFASLIWRLLGAPVTAEQYRGLETHFWQAGKLLPQRAVQVWINWFAYTVKPAETMDQEAKFADETEQLWLNVYLSDEKRLAQMTLKGYVCGVLAEEMPAAYHLEALKAQAVAARTRVLRQMNEGGCSRHPGADICTDSTHCQGYATLAECRKKWGNDYEIYRDRILEAEHQTSSEIMTYEDKPIQVYYHAISGGKTEEASAVFAQDYPYLVSVESQGEEQVRGFRTDLQIGFTELADKLSALTGKNISSEMIQKTLAVNAYTQTGRVASMELAGEIVAGDAFRKALGLRSTLFSITMNEEGVIFHQQGYGHGVGMSQAGANVMASNGYTYEEILLHYYPGVMLKKE